ncbi:hypothetical protein E4K72_02980 [Oxalobacteraceae bacterium OM1]|nr:hypothetical protein E4K72_02980 [Oxalobacteraceae bacterium OM1]
MTNKVTPTRWKPGQSGNPAGRPKGSGLNATMRERLDAVGPAALDAIVAASRRGDLGCSKWLAERMVPPLRPIDPMVIIELPEGASLQDQAEAIVRAVCAGQLAPMQGQSLLSALANIGRVIEITELERRIAALENGHGE